MTDKNQPFIKEHSELLNTSKILIKDISQLIEEARGFVAREYNSTQKVESLLYKRPASRPIGPMRLGKIRGRLDFFAKFFWVNYFWYW